MADAAAGRIPKPQLRGLLAASFRKHSFGAVIFSTSIVFAYKYFVADKRKENYANFYKNYDADKEFEAMRKKGVFQSCPAD